MTPPVVRVDALLTPLLELDGDIAVLSRSYQDDPVRHALLATTIWTAEGNLTGHGPIKTII